MNFKQIEAINSQVLAKFVKNTAHPADSGL